MRVGKGATKTGGGRLHTQRDETPAELDHLSQIPVFQGKNCATPAPMNKLRGVTAWYRCRHTMAPNCPSELSCILSHVPFLYQALSEHVRKLVPSLQPCPVLAADCTFQRESLNRARMELSAWMQHVMLYATVRDSPVFRRFLMDGANASPPYLDVQWAQGVAQTSGPVAGGAYLGGEEDGDDMEMDDLFDRYVRRLCMDTTTFVVPHLKTLHSAAQPSLVARG